MDRQKIFVTDIFHQIYKEFLKLNHKEITKSVKTWAKDLKRYFHQNDMQVTLST